MTSAFHNEENAVVVLANGTNGLGVVRSLASAGLKSIVVSAHVGDLASMSNIPIEIFYVPVNDAWEDSVSTLLSTLSFAVKPPILACSDRAANYIASNVELLSKKYSLLSPSIELTTSLNDKRFEIEKMVSLGVPLPNSISRLDDADFEFRLSTLNFPLIVKPRSFAGYDLINAKNIILNDSAEAEFFRDTYKNHLDEFVLQEVIAGDDDQLWVCNATFDVSSTLVAAFTFQRLGTMPSHFGVTSMAISHLNTKVVEIVKNIGKGIGYVGPAMFEFKYDIKRDEYLYIEINPRLGMCNWFDTCCGVNNAAITSLIASGNPVPVTLTQKENLIYWHFMGDFIARLEGREPIIKIMSRYASLIFKRKVWALFTWYDPYPAISSSFFNVKVLVRRVFKLLAR